MDSPLPSQPSPLAIFYLCFQKVTCNVHELIVPQYNVQKGLISLNPPPPKKKMYIFYQYLYMIHVRKMYKCTLIISLFQRLKFSLSPSEITRIFPDIEEILFSLTISLPVATMSMGRPCLIPKCSQSFLCDHSHKGLALVTTTLVNHRLSCDFVTESSRK